MIPCFIPDDRENLSIFPIWYNIDYRLTICSLHCIEVHPFSYFLQDFYCEKRLNLRKVLSRSSDFCPWVYLCPVLHWLDLHISSHLCIYRMKPTRSFCVIFCTLLNSLGKRFMENVCVCVLQEDKWSVISSFLVLQHCSVLLSG